MDGDWRVRTNKALSAIELDLGLHEAKPKSSMIPRSPARSSSVGALQMQQKSLHASVSMAKSQSTSGLQTLAPLVVHNSRKKLRAVHGLGQSRMQPVAYVVPKVAAGSGFQALRYAKFCQ